MSGSSFFSHTSSTKKPLYLFFFFSLILLFLSLGLYLFFSQTSQIPSSFLDYIPQTSSFPLTINRKYYTLGYSKKHKQSEYVVYLLNKNYLIKKVRRLSRFIGDPLIKETFTFNNDYKGSGFDKGHLLPAADMSFDAQAMKETFYFSNVSPQYPNFNRGIWLKLEKKVREWADDEGDLIVVVGPILEKEGKTIKNIGVNEITVPWGFYKIIYHKSLTNPKIIAFEIPNIKNKQEKPLISFVVSVKKIENDTNINFFSLQSEEWQNLFEQQVNTENWSW